MSTPKQIWAFDEPGPYGGNAHITMTEEEIIEFCRKKLAAYQTYEKSPGWDYRNV